MKGIGNFFFNRVGYSSRFASRCANSQKSTIANSRFISHSKVHDKVTISNSIDTSRNKRIYSYSNFLIQKTNNTSKRFFSSRPEGIYNTIEFWNNKIKVNSNDFKAYSNKGAVLASLGRHEEAIECYDQAIKINPEFAIAYYNKGNALSYLEREEEAIEYYDQAIKYGYKGF